MKSGDPIVDRFCDRLAKTHGDDQRAHRLIGMMNVPSKMGQRKYGTTLARQDLSIKDWLWHAQEEAADLVLYLEALMDHHGADEPLISMQASALNIALQLETRLQSFE
jgi:hypothetical protein